MIDPYNSPGHPSNSSQLNPLVQLSTRFAALVLCASSLSTLPGCSNNDPPNPQGPIIAAIPEEQSGLRADPDGFVTLALASGEVKHIPIVTASDLLTTQPQSGEWVCVKGPFHYASDLTYRGTKSVIKGTSSTEIIVPIYNFHILTADATEGHQVFLRMQMPKTMPLIVNWIDAICGIYYPNNTPELHSPEIERQLTSRDGKIVPTDYKGQPTIDAGFIVTFPTK